MARRATEFAAQELAARFEALKKAVEEHEGTPKEVRELIEAPIALGQNFPTVDLPGEEKVEVEEKPKDAIEPKATRPSAQRRATRN